MAPSVLHFDAIFAGNGWRVAFRAVISHIKFFEELTAVGTIGVWPSTGIHFNPTMFLRNAINQHHSLPHPLGHWFLFCLWGESHISIGFLHVLEGDVVQGHIFVIIQIMEPSTKRSRF